MPLPVEIGLDFGTTNCAVGRLRTQGGEIVLGPWPSVAVWDDDKLTFGQEAKDKISSGDPNIRVIRDVKLLLGSSQSSIAGLPLGPVDIAAQLLDYVKTRLVGEEPVDTAVVGTPVRVSAAHRAALREAASRCGIKTVKFLYEPTAALVGAENLDQLQSRSLVLVVDWGGGTLDVAAVQFESGLFSELSVDGDVADLGGSQIDEELTKRILNRHSRAAADVQRVPDGWSRLKEEVEAAKIEILDGSIDEGDVFPIVPEWLDAEISIRPELVHRTIREFAAKARERIVDLLRRSGIEPRDVTHLLFAGGVCQSHLVVEEITEAFSDADVLVNPEPQLGTARGCTRLTNGSFSLELGADFVVRQCDDSFCLLLRRGQRVHEGTSVTADFWVTDVHASEALFDFGVTAPGLNAFQGATALKPLFRSLQQLILPLGRTAADAKRRSPDLVKLQVGLDSNLNIMAYAVSADAGAQDQVSLGGVPLCIRMVPR